MSLSVTEEKPFAGCHLDRCRACERILLGTESEMCHECEDALCDACGQEFVEVPIPGLVAQLCPECHDKWIEWDDPKLGERPSEMDILRSQERFVAWVRRENVIAP